MGQSHVPKLTSCDNSHEEQQNRNVPQKGDIPIGH